MDQEMSQEWILQEAETVKKFFDVKLPAASRRNPAINPDNRVYNKTICDSIAADIMQCSDIIQAPNQGANSYAVLSPSKRKVVTFRLSALDEGMLATARQIYGPQVPSTVRVTSLPLPTYILDTVPGRIYATLPEPSGPFPLARQLNLVRDLALFLAKGAQHPSDAALPLESWTIAAYDTINDICLDPKLRGLSKSVCEYGVKLLDRLPLLGVLPRVLTHKDLTELNIFIDDAGHLTGVIDLESAGYEAFGMSFFGLYECFFGRMEYPNFLLWDEELDDGRRATRVLQDAFWSTLWENLPAWMQERRTELQAAIEVAIDVSAFNRYLGDPKQLHTERSILYAEGILLRSKYPFE